MVYEFFGIHVFQDVRDCIHGCVLLLSKRFFGTMGTYGGRSAPTLDYTTNYTRARPQSTQPHISSRCRNYAVRGIHAPLKPQQFRCEAAKVTLDYFEAEGHSELAAVLPNMAQSIKVFFCFYHWGLRCARLIRSQIHPYTTCYRRAPSDDDPQ